MRVLVTGAAGFIGRHLAAELAKRGYDVRGLILPHEDSSYLDASGVSVFRGDVTNPQSLTGVADTIDTVYHLAARTLDWGSRDQFTSIMVDGTYHLLEECKSHIKRFVYFSSIAALGAGRPMDGVNETAQRKRCGVPYCDAKIDSEDLVKDFCTGNGIDYTIIRPANVFGPGSVWVYEILDAFQRGPLPLINRGNSPGAFVYIDNLVDGAILAGEKDIARGKIYHFRDDYAITWGEYLTTLGQWVGKAPKGNLPFRAAWIIGTLMEKVLTPFHIRPPITRLAATVMGLNNNVDTQLARQELDWHGRVDLEQAMGRIQSWVETVYKPSKNLSTN